MSATTETQSVYVELPASKADATIRYAGEYYLQCVVSPNGTVRVWDYVAGYYTTCHSLAESQIAEARRLAAR